MKRDVSFYSNGGLKVKGNLYVPDDLTAGEKRPGIMVCQGYTGVKEGLSSIFAERLCALGYVTLVIDYRYWGESEGSPRLFLQPFEQVEDIRNGITFLQMQGEVDPDKIGIFGQSYGGAHAGYVAGIDRRVKCAVSNVGFGDGERVFGGMRRYHEQKDFERMLLEDREKRVTTGETTQVDALVVMNPDPATSAFWPVAVANNPTWDANIALQSAEYFRAYKPESVVHLISPRAMMWVTVENDELVPPEESLRMYNKAGEPKRLVVLPGLSHFDVYYGPGLEKVIEHSIEWLGLHLPLQA